MMGFLGSTAEQACVDDTLVLVLGYVPFSLSQICLDPYCFGDACVHRTMPLCNFTLS